MAEEWIDSHSVNCYLCGKLVDERECIPADAYNGNNGGSICSNCVSNIQIFDTETQEAMKELLGMIKSGEITMEELRRLWKEDKNKE